MWVSSHRGELWTGYTGLSAEEGLITVFFPRQPPLVVQQLAPSHGLTSQKSHQQLVAGPGEAIDWLAGEKAGS